MPTFSTIQSKLSGELNMRLDLGKTVFAEQYSRALRAGAIFLVVISLATSLVLLTQHTHLGGPGDELGYYTQAAHLLPFMDNYYGPSYFVALRVVHDILRVEWFTAGRILS